MIRETLETKLGSSLADDELLNLMIVFWTLLHKHGMTLQNGFFSIFSIIPAGSIRHTSIRFREALTDIQPGTLEKGK